MEKWQAIAAIVFTGLGILGASLKWLLGWLFGKFEDMQKVFTQALKELTDEHTKRLDAKDAKIEELHKAHKDDQKKATAELHALADKMLGRSSSQRPSSR